MTEKHEYNVAEEWYEQRKTGVFR